MNSYLGSPLGFKGYASGIEPIWLTIKTARCRTDEAHRESEPLPRHLRITLNVDRWLYRAAIGLILQGSTRTCKLRLPGIPPGTFDTPEEARAAYLTANQHITSHESAA